MSAVSDLQSIGRNIAIRRETAGYSQERFAEELGISKNALGKIERGETMPRIDKLIAACRELNVTPNEIIPGFLSLGETIDPEMIEIIQRIKMYSKGQKRQLYSMINVIMNGIEHSNS